NGIIVNRARRLHAIVDVRRNFLGADGVFLEAGGNGRGRGHDRSSIGVYRAAQKAQKNFRLYASHLRSAGYGQKGGSGGDWISGTCAGPSTEFVYNSPTGAKRESLQKTGS